LEGGRARSAHTQKKTSNEAIEEEEEYYRKRYFQALIHPSKYSKPRRKKTGRSGKQVKSTANEDR